MFEKYKYKKTSNNLLGFTLIELLAVIVLLAALALITTPAVLNVIEDSRKAAAEENARVIANTAETYYAQHTALYGERVGEIDLTSDILNYKGDKPYKGYVYFDNNGYAYLKMYQDGYCITLDFDNTITAEKTSVKDCKISEITIFLELNGGSLDKELLSYEKGDVFGELPEPTRVGYTFKGWYDALDVIIDPKAVVEKSGTIYAKWEANTYKVKLNPSGVTMPAVDGWTLEDGFYTRLIKYDSLYGTLPTLSKTGYEFAGWYLTNGIKVESDTTLQIPSDHVITAKFVPLKLTITFDYNDNGVTSDTTKEVDYDSPYGNLPVATRYGYDFDGWYNSSNQIVTSETIVKVLSDETLVAHWTAKKYTVTFKYNNGTADTTKEVTFDSPYGELPKPTRLGYTFNGWASLQGEPVTSDTIYKHGDNQTLYGQWGNGNYVATLDPNGGTLTTLTLNVYYDKAYGEIPTPTRTGYDFLGWYLNGTKVDSSTIVNVADNHTLVAEWRLKTFTVTFKYNDGVTADTTKTVTYSKTYGTLPVAERANYCFLGWYTTGGVKVEATTEYYLENDTTLYASWAEAYYLVLNASSAEVGYAQTIYDALGLAQDGYTIKQVRDNTLNLTEPLTINKNITLNTNSHILTLNNYYIDIPTGKTVNVIGNGTIKCNNSRTIENDGTLVLNSVKLEGNNSNALLNYGTATLTSANISSTNLSTVHNYSGAVLSMTNTNITNNTATAFVNYGTTTINGGTIAAKEGNAILIHEGKVTIESGDIHSTNVEDDDTMYPAISNKATLIINNGKVYTMNARAIKNSSGTVTINGGEIYNYGGESIIYVTTAIYNAATLNITNGEVYSLSAGAIRNEGGTATISGGTVYSNLDLYPTITNYSSGILNITGGEVYANDCNTIVNDSGTVTVNGGEVSNVNDVDPYTYPAIYNRSTLKILKGTVYSEHSNAVNNDAGTTTISGGTIYNEGGHVETLRNHNGGTTTISGGTFTSKNIGVLRNMEGTLNINGGTIYNTNELTSEERGASVYNESTLNVTNGTIYSNNSNTIVNDAGTTAISGGTIYNTGEVPDTKVVYPGIYNKENGSITITGGKVYSLYSTPLHNNSGIVNISGGEVYRTNGATDTHKFEAISNKSTLNIKTGAKVYASNDSALRNEGGTLNISGGTVYNTGDTTQEQRLGAIINVNDYDDAGTLISQGKLTITGGTIYSSYAVAINNAAAITNISNATIYNKDNLAVTIVNQESGQLTINSGKIYSQSANTISNMSGTVNIKGGEIYNTASIDENAYVVIANDSTLNISGGTIRTAISSAVLNKGGTINVSGGTIYSTCTTGEYAIRNNSNGTIKITNGTVYGTNAIAVFNYSGTTTISGGKVYSYANIDAEFASQALYNLSTLNVTAGTIYSTNNNVVYNGQGTVTISGGSFSNTHEATDSTYPALYNDATLKVTGGTVTSDAGAAVYNNSTLSIANATITSGTNNAVVNLAGNTTITSGTVTSNGRMTLYCGAGTLKVSGGTFRATDNPTIYVGGGTATFSNGSYESNGFPTVYLVDGTTNISGGTYYCPTSPALYILGGTVNMSGGTVYSPSTTAQNHGGIVNMTGGTIYSTGGVPAVFNGATWTMGVNDGTINNATPIIRSSTTAVQNGNSSAAGTFNFYDGRIQHGSGYYGLYNVSGSVNYAGSAGTGTQTIDGVSYAYMYRY